MSLLRKKLCVAFLILGFLSSKSDGVELARGYHAYNLGLEEYDGGSSNRWLVFNGDPLLNELNSAGHKLRVVEWAGDEYYDEVELDPIAVKKCTSPLGRTLEHASSFNFNFRRKENSSVTIVEVETFTGLVDFDNPIDRRRATMPLLVFNGELPPKSQVLVMNFISQRMHHRIASFVKTIRNTDAYIEFVKNNPRPWVSPLVDDSE